MWNWIEVATRITNPWSLAALAILAFLLVILKRRGKLPIPPWAIVFALMVLVALPTGGWVYLEVQHAKSQTIYRVRVIVVGPERDPVENAMVWSSAGGEPKRVAGGWQFDIPAASRPADGGLTLYASIPESFLYGTFNLRLADDPSPTATIRLERQSSAQIRGIVMDESGTAIAGVRVCVIGFEKEAFATGEGGNFSLPAHAAEGQQVLLHAEKSGYAPATQWHPAGQMPATIVLDRSIH